jgi:ParB family chromosome partitioning protein
VIQTIILVKEGDEVIVDDGRQRVLCTREANRRLRAAGLPPIMVPAIQKRGTPAKLHGLMVSANEFRYAVSTIERAEKAQRLIDMGQSEEEAGVALGVTVQAIKNWLKLLEVIPAGRKAVESGHASASAIAKLAGKPREEQQKAIEKIVAASTETGKKATARSVTKATGGTVAPAKRFIKKIADAIQTKDPKASAILGWILGELDNKEICERVPAMANAMETASAAKPVKVKQSKAKKAA